MCAHAFRHRRRPHQWDIASFYQVLRRLFTRVFFLCIFSFSNSRCFNGSNTSEHRILRPELNPFALSFPSVTTTKYVFVLFNFFAFEISLFFSSFIFFFLLLLKRVVLNFPPKMPWNICNSKQWHLQRACLLFLCNHCCVLLACYRVHLHLENMMINRNWWKEYHVIMW